MSELIHHYTSLETLALILKHKTLRFNRLDRVDDVNEAQAVSGIQFGKCFFASCWTNSSEESIPLWHMYTNEMTGVRISLPVHMFKLRPLVPDLKLGFVSQGTILSPVPFEKLITSSYFLQPTFLDQKHFFDRVHYADSVEEEYKRAVEIHRDETRGTAGIKIHDPCRLARLKKKVWEFQAECRFVLFALPSMPLPPLGFADPGFAVQLSTALLNALLKGEGPGIEYFDVELEERELDKILVTAGPLCSEGQYLIAESLVAEFTTQGRVVRSNLAGSIRRSQR